MEIKRAQSESEEAKLEPNDVFSMQPVERLKATELPCQIYPLRMVLHVFRRSAHSLVEIAIDINTHVPKVIVTIAPSARNVRFNTPVQWWHSFKKMRRNSHALGKQLMICYSFKHVGGSWFAGKDQNNQVFHKSMTSRLTHHR
eukprot:5110685-Amphidinium_carterae.1